MKPDASLLKSILVDPVTLSPLEAPETDPFLDARVGGLSNKNEKEIHHFLKAYAPQNPSLASYLRRVPGLPKPSTDENSVILDIGCGPYDCISAIPGRHIFLDDIMDVYVDKLSASHDGLRICARTELMPVATSSVDIVYSVNMIDHVDDMSETILEIHRILKHTGKVYLQTYFNSHPLLETEPGVFDRNFLDNHVSPYFNTEFIRTFAMGDPALPSSYTMDILACVLSPKDAPTKSLKPRSRYYDAGYIGPQSRISNAIRELSDGRDGASYLVGLENEDCYALHLQLLRAWGMIVRNEFGPANSLLKELKTWERVRKNPFARIAILTLENKRISASTRRPKEVAV